jgi:glycosyltransferase involved in cell wall biosynthesis
MSARGARVLVLPEQYWPSVGGIEYLLQGLLPDLARRGHEFMVLTASHGASLPSSDEHDGIPIRRVPIRDAIQSGDPTTVMRLRRQVEDVAREFKPDVIHGHGVGLGTFVQLTARRASDAKFIVTLHLALDKTPPTPDSAVRRVLDEATRVTVVSDTLGESTLQHLPSLGDRLSVIPNGLIPPTLKPEPLPFGPPVVLCLGRLVEAKGFDIAIRALRMVASKFPTLRMIVAGPGDPAELLHLAVDQGVSDRIEFAGVVDHSRVPDMMNRATVVLMPSREEGHPLVAIEAALMARPVIGSRIIGLRDIVIHDKTGLLVPPEDPVACAAAIEALLSNPERTGSMGMAARAHALATFSWEHCVDAYDALYRSVLKEGSR